MTDDQRAFWRLPLGTRLRYALLAVVCWGLMALALWLLVLPNHPVPTA